MKNRFTLIELLVVIGIIGILMAILLPAISGAISESKKTQVESQMRQIQIGVKLFENTYGHYPTVNWPTRQDVDYSITANEFFTIIQDNDIDVNPDAQNPRAIEINEFTHPQEKEYTIYLDGNYDGKVNGNIKSSIAVETTFSNETIKSWD